MTNNSAIICGPGVQTLKLDKILKENLPTFGILSQFKIYPTKFEKTLIHFEFIKTF